MKLVYSKRSKKCLGTFNGIDGDFVQFVDEDDKEKEGHKKNVVIIADQEQLEAFLAGKFPAVVRQGKVF